MAYDVAERILAAMSSTGPLDFSLAMLRVCEDICQEHTRFRHIDMSQIAVTFAQARSHVLHGLQAKLTPMRFENGQLAARREGQMWTVQRLFMEQREMLYILTFYLPRFLNQPFREKLVTVFHELFHISPQFDGDIRRLPGHFHVHSHSQKEYDDQMGVYVDEYLASQPGPLLDFLKGNFQLLRDFHGGVVGLQVPIPKLIPCDDRKSA
jgi:hypothetical protein